MFKRVLPLVLALTFTACGSSFDLKNSGDDSLGETLDKAWDDTKAEGKRFNDSIIEVKDDSNDTLKKANSDFNSEYHRVAGRTQDTLKKANDDFTAEEHRVSGNTKDTLAKVNSDFNDEEHRASGNTKDTLAKANSDVVDEEHRFNDVFKTTTKKANMDVIGEGDKITDRIIGSDDKTTDQHGDSIRDHELRIAALERLTKLHTDAISNLFVTIDSEAQARRLGDLSNASSIQTVSSDLQTLSSDLRGLLVALQDSAEALAGQVNQNTSDITAVIGRVTSLESAMLTIGDVTQAIASAIAAIPADTDPVCTLTLTPATVQFTDFTDRDGSGAYCYKNSQPWNTSTPNSHNQCQGGWTYVPANYYGDEGVTNSITVNTPSLSCTTSSN